MTTSDPTLWADGMSNALDRFAELVTSDPTPGDHDELLAEADRQANYLKAKDLDGWGLLEDLTAALRTEQSARQAAEELVANYEKDAVQRSEDGRTDWDYEQRIKRVEAERDALQQRIDAALALHSERDWRPLDGTYLGGNVCNHCRTSWPCADVRALTATTESEESEPEGYVSRFRENPNSVGGFHE